VTVNKLSRPAKKSWHGKAVASGSQRSEAVLISLRRIIRAIDLHSRRLSMISGLTIPQIVALRSIRDMGEVTTGQLATRMSLSQGTASTILDRLERRGLIERYRSSRDRRIVHARLTGEGRKVLRKAPPLLHERFIERFLTLGPTDQDRIVDTLQEVAEMMGAAELDAAPVLDVGPLVDGKPIKDKR
jgi:DNA-binding MarR family transcriptional regulator